METIESSAKEKAVPHLTLGMVTGLIRLSKLQIRALFSGILRQPVPDETILLSDAAVLFLLTADLVERLPFLKPEQRNVLLAEFWPTLESAGPQLFSQLNQFVFVDSQFCTWTRMTGFLDLQQGEWVTELPHPAMETIGYNLNELYRRGRRHIEKRSGLHAKHRAGSVEEPGNVRVGSPDHVSGPVWDGSPDMGPDHDRAGN
jgi:hypothetical protein